MFTPQNEQGVVVLFAKLADAAGWNLIEIGCKYPDAIFKKDDELWKIEFEFYASNFLDHKHDHRDCDIIVCWEDDYPGCPMPVIELSRVGWDTSQFQKCDPVLKEIEYWKRRCIRAEHQLKIREIELGEYVIQPPSNVDFSPSQAALEALRMQQEGMTVAQIAEALQKSPRSISNYLRDAKASLPTIAPVHTNGYHKAQEA